MHLSLETLGVVLSSFLTLIRGAWGGLRGGVGRGGWGLLFFNCPRAWLSFMVTLPIKVLPCAGLLSLLGTLHRTRGVVLIKYPQTSREIFRAI